MKHIMGILRASEPKYVRCIKPNAAQRSALYEEGLVQQQLRYLGAAAWSKWHSLLAVPWSDNAAVLAAPWPDNPGSSDGVCLLKAPG